MGSDPWGNWIEEGTSCTGTYHVSSAGTSSTDVIWGNWCDSVTVTSTSATNLIWLTWCSGTFTDSSVSRVYVNAPPPVKRTPAEIRVDKAAQRQHEAEQERIREEYRARERERAVARERASKRAEETLLEHLHPEQRASWREKGHFVVHGRSGLRYRVNRYASGNIDVVNRDGVVQERLCVHCNYSANVPAADQLLAQKLHLEADEESVVRIANKHGGTGQQVLPSLH